MSNGILNILYLVSASLFIIGLKGLAHPRTAVRGNLTGAAGMLLAIAATLVAGGIANRELILAGLAAGSLIGAFLAVRIQMSAMPQLVGLYNGFGGIASVLVAGAVLYRARDIFGSIDPVPAIGLQEIVATAAGALIGAATFWGSLVAFGKLQGIITEKPVRYKAEQVIKAIVAAACIAAAVFLVLDPADTAGFWILAGLGSALGILLVIPIGGADMPIVIALLNSYSGLAAAATGFVLTNTVLIVAGSLVGASGIILTRVMCKAMNRSLANVLFGGVGAVREEAQVDDIYAGKVKATSAEEVAMILKSAQRVAVVPGYGMAVARAQGPVRELTQAMEAEGIRVDFGIHPVAGRMPGHMNVLLAEEDIPYDKLLEMDQINSEFPNIDVVLVLGANDVVNPAAREPSGSPISGMPILNVDKARTVVVIKRSLSPGFAGISNPLFAADNTLMLFGDGRQAMENLVKSFREA